MSATSYTYTRLVDLFDTLEDLVDHEGGSLTPEQQMDLHNRAQSLRQLLIAQALDPQRQPELQAAVLELPRKVVA